MKPRIVDLTKPDDHPDVLKSYSIEELSRWASAMSLFEMMPLNVSRPMLRLMGRRPYMFERNTGRWPDGQFHLVDRGYEEYHGIVLNYEQLRSADVLRWQKSQWRQVGADDDAHILIDDVFANSGVNRRRAFKELSRVFYGILRELDDAG